MNIYYIDFFNTQVVNYRFGYQCSTCHSQSGKRKGKSDAYVERFKKDQGQVC